MPGLHMLISTNAINQNEKQKFLKTLSKMRHFQWYSTEVLCDDANIIIGRSYYEGYPFAQFRSEKGITLIDGAIYDKSAVEVREELDKISLEDLSVNELLNKTRDFLLQTHGEFIVVKYNRARQRCFVFNDALGRLPFYFCSSDNQPSDLTIMSREVKFIVPFLTKTDYDRMSIAEYLIFGYPLGGRTLWKSIARLPPAGSLMRDSAIEKFRSRKVLSWNLESGNQTPNELKEETKKLVALFITSSKNIARTFPRDYTHLVGLSGGLDSRATLGSLVKIGADPVACSYPSGENNIALKVARTLKTRHWLIRSSFELTNTEYTYLTDGLIGVRLRHLASYLGGLREKAGEKALLYTGDGGWQLKCIRSLRFGISNIEELVHHIIETEHTFDIDEVSSMLNMQKRAFKDHLRKYLTTYPEKTMEGKMVHFKVFERFFNLMFLGEDKNRLFLWSTTPFYSIHLFRASMKVGQRSKEHFALYKNFLETLNPSLARIQYYNKLLPLSTPNLLLKPYLSIFEQLQRRFHERGTTNPIEKMFGKRTQERTDELRKLVLGGLAQDVGIGCLDRSRATEIANLSTNSAELSGLASLVIFAGLTKSQYARSGA